MRKGEADDLGEHKSKKSKAPIELDCDDPRCASPRSLARSISFPNTVGQCRVVPGGQRGVFMEPDYPQSIGMKREDEEHEDLADERPAY